MTQNTPTYPHAAVDLFAGPGGWDVAARRLGLDVIGIELDRHAVATREASGLPTICGDVRDYGPSSFPHATTLVASPPCQTFSAAGNGAGRSALGDVLEALTALVESRTRPEGFADERTALVLEPMRWVLAAIDAGRPFETVVLEQVPAVQPVWDAYAEVLRGYGYSVATDRLNAEQFGVPQVRKRAVLIAVRTGRAQLPSPTHSKFHHRDSGRLDEGVLPWVSMETVLRRGGEWSVRDSFGAPRLDYPGREAARWKPSTRPAPAVTGKVGSWAIKASNGDPSDHPRVTIAEAAALQTFPADHAWRGGKTSQYQQIGNAVPPLLAEAILCAALNG